jgi:hypothetical protein
MIKFLLLFVFILQVQAGEQTYKRSLFGTWTDPDRNCFDTRHDVLRQRSLVTVTFEKKKSRCRVLTGKWNDFYYDEVITDAQKTDIDHVVPLKHAFEIGASEWTTEKRKNFATDPENLVITNRSYNRTKGAKTILQWMPVNKSYACKYIAKWVAIKKKYELLIDQKELDYISMLKCE